MGAPPFNPLPAERLIGPPLDADAAESPLPSDSAEAIAIEEIAEREEDAESAAAPSQAAPEPPPSAPPFRPRAAEPPPPETAPVVTCARCGQTVSVADLVSGAAGRRGGFLLCAACLPHHPPDTTDSIPDSATGLLRESLLELRRIGRRFALLMTWRIISLERPSRRSSSSQ